MNAKVRGSVEQNAKERGRGEGEGLKVVLRSPVGSQEPLIFLVSLQVYHRQANCWCIINLLGLDGLGAVHQEVSHAWNICCDVYKYTENIHEVFHDLRLVPCCFCTVFFTPC